MTDNPPVIFRPALVVVEVMVRPPVTIIVPDFMDMPDPPSPTYTPPAATVIPPVTVGCPHCDHPTYNPSTATVTPPVNNNPALATVNGALTPPKPFDVAWEKGRKG